MVSKVVLSILLAAVFATVPSTTRTTYADSQYQINVHVENSQTGFSESGSTCAFTFNPSGNIVTNTTDSSGVTQAADSITYDSTVDVSCIGTDGNVGTITGIPLSVQQNAIHIMLAKLAAPSQIQNLQASAASFGSGPVTLTWQAPSSNGGSPVRDYYIYRGTSQGTETFFSMVSSSTATYLDSSTSPGNSYYYYVTAANAAGSSQPSSEVSVVVSCFGDGGAFCN
ncbi:MAG: fibronectin type III domain-containing protein [Thaumarchaeota archaeon]|nr:fibronectin type III domain-containing protein [Nitrososphaerota archaeon]